MAVREIIVSDVSGEDIPDDKHARIIVNEHPAISGPVELDVSTTEAGKLQSSKLDLVTVTIHEPNTLPRRVILEASAFAKLFKDDVEGLLAKARRHDDGGTTTRQRRTRGSGSGSASPKIDYLAHENYGLLHRGKVTDAEAQLVRDNLDTANANRKREGQPEIDPNDAKEKKRYGF